MSNFSDEEDRQIFQLAKKYYDSGEKIIWKSIANKMSHTNKTKDAIRIRFKTLKRTHGSDLDNFPPRFSRPVVSKPIPKASICKKRIQNKIVLSKFSGKGVSPHILEMLSSFKKQVRPFYPSCEVHEIVYELFRNVKHSVLNQKSGEAHLNTGEVAVDGISRVLTLLDINCNDSFVDIGSGIGNILAQVALESPVHMCFGIECQAKLVKLSKNIMRMAIKKFPQLGKVSMSAEDIRAPKWHTEVHLRCSTILYSNNVIFEAVANLQLEEFVTCQNELRFVVLSTTFCSRHRNGCSRLFCQQWELFEIVEVPVHWCSNLVALHVFRKKSKNAFHGIMKRLL